MDKLSTDIKETNSFDEAGKQFIRDYSEILEKTGNQNPLAAHLLEIIISSTLSFHVHLSCNRVQFVVNL